MRRYCGVSATEALYGLPDWEVDLLVAGLDAEFHPDEPAAPAHPQGRYSLTTEED